MLIISLLFETIITLLWGLSSALLMEIYWEYCKMMEDNGSKCGTKDQRFVSVPILGFICAAGWVRLLEIIRIIIPHTNLYIVVYAGVYCYTSTDLQKILTSK